MTYMTRLCVFWKLVLHNQISMYKRFRIRKMSCILYLVLSKLNHIKRCPNNACAHTHKHNLHIWSRIWAYWRLLKISLMHMKNIDNIYTNKLIFSVVSRGEGEGEPEKGLSGRERDLNKRPKPTETKND